MSITAAPSDDHTQDQNTNELSSGNYSEPDPKTGVDPDQSTSSKKNIKKRGRPRIKPDELATKRIEVRVHPSVFAQFSAQCAAKNLSVPAAVRQMVTTGQIHAPVVKPGPNWNAIEKHVLRNLTAYGNNFNQLMAALNLGLLKQNVDPAILCHLGDDLRLAMQVLEQLKAAIRTTSAAPTVSESKTKKIRWPWFGRGA